MSQWVGRAGFDRGLGCTLRFRRCAMVVVAYLSGTLPSAIAGEDASTRQCLSAYEGGQRSRKAGAFSEAKAAFSLCGGPSCPEALHADCSRWLEEVEAAMPTSVFFVVDAETGAQLPNVRLSIDGGEPVTLDGRALSFDPGEHSLTFSSPKFQSAKESFTFTEGEKLVSRRIELRPVVSIMAEQAVVEPPQELPRPPAQQSQTTMLPVWIGASIGALGAAGFAYYGLAARSHDRALGECSPGCSSADVNQVKNEYRNANIALGVGGAGLVVAAGWLLFGPEGDSRQEASGPSLALHVGPTTWLLGEF